MDIMDILDEKYEALVKVLCDMEVIRKKRDQSPVVQATISNPNVESHPSVIKLKLASKEGTRFYVYYPFHFSHDSHRNSDNVDKLSRRNFVYDTQSQFLSDCSSYNDTYVSLLYIEPP